jgi:hypothetical protein
MPTSKEINTAIEVLRSAQLYDTLLDDIDYWNMHRLKALAQAIESPAELRSLLAGYSSLDATAIKPGDTVRHVATDGRVYVGVIKEMWDSDHAVIGLHHYPVSDLEVISEVQT